MKFKAVRASLAAVLAAALLVSLVPLSYADARTSQSPQAGASSRQRRGKNGEPLAKNTESQDAAATQQHQAQVSQSEASKTVSTLHSAGQKGSESSEPVSQAAGQAPNTDPQQDSAEPQQQREAPPFDRPPLGARGRSNSDSGERGSYRPSGSGQRSSSSGADNRGQSQNRSQSSDSAGTDRSRYPDSSAGAEVDPERTERSSGRAPVLQRPADSRSGDRSGSTDGRAPVLRRPSDPSPRGDSSSSDINVGRPSNSDRQQQGRGGQQQSDGDDPVIKLESTLVNIPLLVSDRSGRYIPQLSARDFALFEDNAPQTIASFGSEEVPFSVALLLDVSPSVQGSVTDIQDAAIAFVRQLRSQDRVMVVSFDRQIHYLSDFTSDRGQLEWAIRRANTGSGTSVYDAVYETVQRKLRNIEGRKALILFSDGEDTTSSRASYDDAVDAVSEADVLVYGLRYPGNGGSAGGWRNPWPRSPVPGIQLPFPLPFPWPMPRRRRGPFTFSNWGATGNSGATSAGAQSWPRRRGGSGGDFMKDITAAGGGPVYDAERIGDMSGLAHRIAEELRHVYVISYYPTNALSNGGYRRVRVSVKGRDDIAVRHRPGYNARPNGAAKPTI